MSKNSIFSLSCANFVKKNGQLIHGIRCMLGVVFRKEIFQDPTLLSVTEEECRRDENTMFEATFYNTEPIKEKWESPIESFWWQILYSIKCIAKNGNIGEQCKIRAHLPMVMKSSSFSCIDWGESCCESFSKHREKANRQKFLNSTTMNDLLYTPSLILLITWIYIMLKISGLPPNASNLM